MCIVPKSFLSQTKTSGKHLAWWGYCIRAATVASAASLDGASSCVILKDLLKGFRMHYHFRIFLRVHAILRAAGMQMGSLLKTRKTEAFNFCGPGTFAMGPGTDQADRLLFEFGDKKALDVK